MARPQTQWIGAKVPLAYGCCCDECLPLHSLLIFITEMPCCLDAIFNIGNIDVIEVSLLIMYKKVLRRKK